MSFNPYSGVLYLGDPSEILIVLGIGIGSAAALLGLLSLVLRYVARRSNRDPE